MNPLMRFLRFWYDFIVGDDWTVAVGVIITLGLTAWLARTGYDAWWLLPIAVVCLLGLSLWRVMHKSTH